VAQSLQEQAAALQKVTRFGDETIIEAQALIASFVKDEEAIKAATVATLDLAEAKGFDLVSAADLVSKTLGSSTNALTRYGIEVTGAVGSSERLESLTNNIANVFGGRATKATETFSVKVQQLGNAWSDLGEAVGEAITNNEDASKSIDDLTKSVAEIAPAVAKFAVVVLKLATAIGKVTAAVFEFQAKIQTFIPNLIRTQIAAADSAVSMDAMATTAKRLGISVDELQDKLDRGVRLNDAVTASTKEMGEAMAAAADGTAQLANEQEKIKTEAEESAPALAEVATETEKVGTKAEAAGESVEQLGTSFEGTRQSAVEMTSVMATLNAGLALNRTFLANTAIAYDTLKKKIGETAAQQSALSSGMAQLSQGGTRIRFAGGGSRLVNTTGRGSSSYALSPFGTGGRYNVNADGNMEPE
jgi:transposase